MGISDWSSDVGSSDLTHVFDERIRAHETVAQSLGQVAMRRQHDVAAELAAGHALAKEAGAAVVRHVRVEVDHGGVDRKSVVYGKRVSVRVDLGGRLFLKHNNT